MHKYDPGIYSVEFMDTLGRKVSPPELFTHCLAAQDRADEFAAAGGGSAIVMRCISNSALPRNSQWGPK